MKNSESILVVVPHPDDEALLAAGLIRRAVTDGKKISVALVTNGDYLCPDHSKGEARLGETLSAMKKLGVREENIYFLGFPDTGYEPEIAFLCDLRRAEDPYKIYPSSCSRETYGISGVKEDFCFLRTGKHAPYTRAAFEAELNALLEAADPDLVITTGEFDEHGDHTALSWFTRRALRQRSPRPRLWEGIVHSPAGDLSWPVLEHYEDPLTCIPDLETVTTLRWEERISVPTPPDTDKLALISSYHTALNPDEPEVVAYLKSFAKADEVFWEIPL